MTRMKSSTKNEILGLVVLVFLAAVFIMISFSMTEERNKAFRSEIKSVVDQEMSQMYHVVGVFSVKAQVSGFVECDRNGIVTSMNELAKKVLRLHIGSHVEDCMSAEMREHHKGWYQDAMKAHNDGTNIATSIVCTAFDPDGEQVKVLVQVFTTFAGASMFVTKLKQEFQVDVSSTP